MFEKQLYHLDPVLLASDVEWRESVQSPRIRVRTPVQEEFSHPHVSTVGGHVQGSQIIDSHLVDGGAMREQLAGGLHMVPLGRHVKGGQAVLTERKINRNFAQTCLF